MAVVTAHTSVLMGAFTDFHAYAEKILGRPVWTHEFATLCVWHEIAEKSEKDWKELCGRLTEEEMEILENAAKVGQGDYKFIEMYNRWNREAETK